MAQDIDVEYEDLSNDRKYWTQIPNIIFEIGLSIWAQMLYIHIKRTCGANRNNCYQGTKALAKGSNMSVGQIPVAKRELEAQGLIKVIHRDISKHESDIIQLLDIWPRNMAYFTKSSTTPPIQDMNSPPIHTVNSPIHSMNVRRTCKKEQDLKTPYPPQAGVLLSASADFEGGLEKSHKPSSLKANLESPVTTKTQDSDTEPPHAAPPPQVHIPDVIVPASALRTTHQSLERDILIEPPPVKKSPPVRTPENFISGELLAYHKRMANGALPSGKDMRAVQELGKMLVDIPTAIACYESIKVSGLKVPGWYLVPQAYAAFAADYKPKPKQPETPVQEAIRRMTPNEQEKQEAARAAREYAERKNKK